MAWRQDAQDVLSNNLHVPCFAIAEEHAHCRCGLYASARAWTYCRWDTSAKPESANLDELIAGGDAGGW
jgi:hypothetical protein